MLKLIVLILAIIGGYTIYNSFKSCSDTCSLNSLSEKTGQIVKDLQNNFEKGYK